MEENIKINYSNYPRPKYDNSLDLHPHFKSYNLSGISDYKNKKNFKDKNLLKPNCLLNNIYNEENNDMENTKISFIKNLIKKPDDLLYDGYLCIRKKPTINYLLKKTKTKENAKLIEENILFKNPYPLLNYLSNRKLPNKSRQLITGILSAEISDLSIGQKIVMKYKPSKSFIKLSKLEFPAIKQPSTNRLYANSNSFLKTEGNFSMSIISKHTRPKFKINFKKNEKNVKDVNLNGFLSNTYLTKKIYSNKKGKIINNIKKYKSCDYNKLKDHETMTDNISFLRKSSKKAFKIKNINHILKDISLLKYNKHLMSLNN